MGRRSVGDDGGEEDLDDADESNEERGEEEGRVGEDEERVGEDQERVGEEEEGVTPEDPDELVGEAKKEVIESSSSSSDTKFSLPSPTLNQSTDIPTSITTDGSISTSFLSSSSPTRRLPETSSSSSSSLRRRSDRILLKFGPEKRRSARIGK